MHIASPLSFCCVILRNAQDDTLDYIEVIVIFSFFSNVNKFPKIES